MKTIWFVSPYGNIPGEKKLDSRYVRFGKVLAKQGYKVIWWTANFSHGYKKLRYPSRKMIQVTDNFTIELIPTSTYQKNISLGRVLFELSFARNLGNIFRHIQEPDLIITSGTGLFTAFRPCWPYTKRHKVPAVFDIMDIHMINTYMKTNHRALAPFVALVTKLLSMLERPFYRSLSGLCGLGKNQLEYAKQLVGNDAIPSCLVYNSIYVTEFREKMKKPCSIDLPQKADGEIWCVYAGALGPSYDINLIIECADRVKANNIRMHFIIAGRGPQAETVMAASKANDRITYLGSLDVDDLIPIYAHCDIGLSTYAAYSTVDMPDKFYDYCAAGLAMVNSLRGEVKDHILNNEAGYQYESGNADSLFDCLTLLQDKDILNKCKANAYTIGDQFDMGNMMVPLLNMIESITDKSGERK